MYILELKTRCECNCVCTCVGVSVRRSSQATVETQPGGWGVSDFKSGLHPSRLGVSPPRPPYSWAPMCGALELGCEWLEGLHPGQLSSPQRLIFSARTNASRASLAAARASLLLSSGGQACPTM